MKKHVVFDYNGTLGVAVDFWGDLDQHYGIDEEESREMVSRYHDGEVDGKKVDEWRVNRYNDSENDSSIDAIESFYREYYERNGLKDGAKELVEKFRDAGFQIHLISHAPTGYVERPAEELGIDNVVDTNRIVASDKIEKIDWKLEDKEDLLERLDGEIWFFGDGIGDFNSAEKADRGFLINNLEHADYEQADAFIGSFDEVKEKAEELVEEDS
ncbi:MAG: HAD family hydrolase [Candidatus Nanohaloarchaea archaeon]